MDEPSRQAWTAFVESYEAYHLSLGNLRHFDMVDANRDGQITREERIQRRQRMRTERRSG